MNAKRLTLALLLVPIVALAQFGRLGGEAAHTAIKQDAAARSADAKPKATTNGAKAKPDEAKGAKAAPETSPKAAPAAAKQQAR